MCPLVHSRDGGFDPCSSPPLASPSLGVCCCCLICCSFLFLLLGLLLLLSFLCLLILQGLQLLLHLAVLSFPHPSPGFALLLSVLLFLFLPNPFPEICCFLSFLLLLPLPPSPGVSIAVCSAVPFPLLAASTPSPFLPSDCSQSPKHTNLNNS